MYANPQASRLSMPANSQLNAQRKANQARWLAFVFLTAVFFLMAHDFGHASRATDNYNLTRDELAARSVEGPPGRRIALALLAITGILSLLYSRIHRRLSVQGLMGWTFVLFVGWACVSPLWASDPALTMKRLVPFLILCIAGIAVATRFSLRDIVQWTFVSTLFYACTGVVATLAYGNFHPITAGYRFGGTLDPNSQGVNCALLLLAAGASGDLDKRWRLPAVIGGLFAVVLLILTGSRTGLAAALFAFAAYLLVTRSKKTILAGAAAISIVSLCLLLFAGIDLAPYLGNAVLMGRADAGSVDSFNGRSLIWQDLSGNVRQHPVLGVGYGSFWTPARINEISDQEKLGGISSSHSAYLEYLLALGWVGLTGYSILLLYGIWQAFREYALARNLAYAFLGSLLVFCIVDGILDSDITLAGTPLMFLWMVVTARLAVVENTVPARIPW
jgi:exopolysaccharide production protein ExoQ